MYHIKNDKRSKKSAQIIVEALYECLKIKPFVQITVTDVQKVGGIGRATFYRLFDTTVDVLEFECNSIFENMLAEYDSMANSLSMSPFESLFGGFINYMMWHVQLLDALENSGRIDILMDVFSLHASAIGKLLCPNTELPQREKNYFVATAGATVFGVFNAWLAQGRKENSHELVEILKQNYALIAQSFGIQRK